MTKCNPLPDFAVLKSVRGRIYSDFVLPLLTIGTFPFFIMPHLKDHSLN